MNTASATVLIGLESSGKSALFRALTGRAADEANFRGSTVICHRCHSAMCRCVVVDTPGIRVRADAETTRLALGALDQGDRVALVLRATHLTRELAALLETTDLRGRRAALVVTFADRAPEGLGAAARGYAAALGIPLALVNARRPDAMALQDIARALEAARPINTGVDFALLQPAGVNNPPPGIFEHPWLGPSAAVLAVLLLFALPVYAAYLLANTLQGPVDSAVIDPLVAQLEVLPPRLAGFLTGPYGVLTLGWYSFLWAFPVVLFVGLSTALAEETGLKDRITSALDPALRFIGLSGRDLAPVLSGFGCNVVAVFQSRSCSACTRRACVSMITLGSACSYQIGATLSVFNTSGHPWMFLPYLALLFAVGAIHTRIWHGALARAESSPLHERAFLQAPSWQAVRWRVAAVVRMFLVQAMPIFLLICVVAAALEMWGLVTRLADWAGPGLGLLGLPEAAAPAVLFSILRKDGLLILNEGNGALLASLTASQVFLLVYLASTLTACLVTIWTLRKELGPRTALTVAGRQALTAIASTWLLSFVLR